MRKILTVIGARPQFIKASVVSHAISQKADLQEVVVHTGQHYDANMSDVFFADLGMRHPHYNLEIGGGGHGQMTGRMLAELELVMLDERPDVVLVYGDTNSTLAGALSAAKLHVPVAHVEAGLRSFNIRMPEEINRILTDRISRWLFTPTQAAASHLRREGVDEERIIPVGDVMYDVALHHGARVKPEGGMLGKLNLQPKGYVLATVHRAENTDDPWRLASILNAVRDIAKKLPVIWPLHPRTRGVLETKGQLVDLPERMHMVDPVGYLDMVQMEKNAALILTDSGGVQKEAFFHRVPCVTLRDETEWVELIDAGWNRLAPPVDAKTISKIVDSALGTTGADINPYGQGYAAQQIVEKIRI
jgi:UDP-GlcNAc3NAcA epimerase